jgi:hypothetical protein
MTPEDLAMGRRIQAPVWTDAWMSGDRYGVVKAFRNGLLYVKMDKSGRTRRFRESECSYVE